MSNLIQQVNCLSKKELDEALKIVKLFEDQDYQEAMTSEGVDDKVRVCQVRPLFNEDYRDTDLQAVLKEAPNRAVYAYTRELANVSPDLPKFLQGYSYVQDETTYNPEWEGWQLLKYDSNQFYGWHADQSPLPWVNTHTRILSIVLYLNNTFDGGRTLFAERAYKPYPGQALVFPSDPPFRHCSEPIEEGTKYALVNWLRSPFKIPGPPADD